jgi:hypothetical protein
MDCGPLASPRQSHSRPGYKFRVDLELFLLDEKALQSAGRKIVKKDMPRLSTGCGAI